MTGVFGAVPSPALYHVKIKQEYIMFDHHLIMLPRKLSRSASSGLKRCEKPEGQGSR